MKKGRNKELSEARDYKMFERYYYWTEIRRLRFDDALKKLSEEEFFVSESRVMQIVRRQINKGATVDGQRILKPLFSGFKIRSSESARKVRCVEKQLSLFDK